MTSLMQRLVSALPSGAQQSLRRTRFARQIRQGAFRTPEPEWDWVAGILREGDWAVDVGANIGHYTTRFSNLVGPSGRVFAFEPITDTFDILASNVGALPHRNVTLLNAAVSESATVAHMVVPSFDTGLANYYEAHLEAGATGTSSAGEQDVFCFPVDALLLPRPVRLVKIDAEGHEPAVLRGMACLVERDRPYLILEVNDGLNEAPGPPDRGTIGAWLDSLGYTRSTLPDSPNCVFSPR